MPTGGVFDTAIGSAEATPAAKLRHVIAANDATAPAARSRVDGGRGHRTYIPCWRRRAVETVRRPPGAPGGLRADPGSIPSVGFLPVHPGQKRFRSLGSRSGVLIGTPNVLPTLSKLYQGRTAFPGLARVVRDPAPPPHPSRNRSGRSCTSRRRRNLAAWAGCAASRLIRAAVGTNPKHSNPPLLHLRHRGRTSRHDR